MIRLASRWGVLPIALALAWIVVARTGALVFRDRPALERLLGGLTLSVGAFVFGVRVLGAFGAIGSWSLFGGLVAAAAALTVAARGARLDLHARRAVTRETLGIVAVGVAGGIVAFVAAYLMPVWQWDAIGYHLPFVNFALQSGGLEGVPSDVPYLSTYPHDVELLYVAWRAMLPDDRLVDAAQIPLGLLGAVAIAALARREGARPEHAVAAGLAWLALPAVFLQLPTNYVDVASASFLLAAGYFVLGEPTAKNLLVTGVAMGLFLGSKPNAPVGTSVVMLAVAHRAWRAPRESGARAALGAAIACALVLGAESYLVNLVRHGNPIWPVKLAVGPLRLPGTYDMRELLESGAAAPRVHGPLPLRVLRSWTTLDAPPVFDMRYGGLGPVFLVALPVAIVHAVRRRSWALLALTGAALASPDPAVPRYVLAFPGLVLALAAPLASSLASRARAALLGAVALASAWGLHHATPGLAGDGPPLLEYFRMSEAERAMAVGADGPPDKFFEALSRLGPGDRTAFDASFDLPYFAWPPDLSHRAIRIPDQGDAAARLLEDPSLRLLIVGDATPAGDLVRARADRFSPLFHCKSSSCTVYIRL